MAFKLSSKSVLPVVKTGLKVMVPVGAGFLFGRMGSEVAKATFPKLAAFANKSAMNEGLVRLLVGIPLGLLGAWLLSKKNVKTFAKLAALSVAGTFTTALQPTAQKHIDSATVKLKSMFAKGSTPALPAPGVPSAAGFLPERAAGTANPYFDLAQRNLPRTG